jgi:hypothetical protein
MWIPSTTNQCGGHWLRIGYALLGEASWSKWKNNVCDLQRAFEQETKSFKLQ